jgi:hypothetical protein
MQEFSEPRWLRLLTHMTGIRSRNIRLVPNSTDNRHPTDLAGCFALRINSDYKLTVGDRAARALAA